MQIQDAVSLEVKTKMNLLVLKASTLPYPQITSFPCPSPFIQGQTSAGDSQMDPPQSTLSPVLPAAMAATPFITPNVVAAASTMQLNYPDQSYESSPCSLHVETRSDQNEPLPTVIGANLRLMCSYGGHVIPRPHDKSLCYVGGETRMVVVDRQTSFSDLCTRLSHTLIHGRPFTLKYQLPNEELDSLITVSTDEDLENMVEEYDRLTTAYSPLKPSSRLRLFLFFSKPETAMSMGSLLDDAKSETWFVDALNNSALLPRNLSDSATMDCLIQFDRVPMCKMLANSDSCNGLDAQGIAETNSQAELNKQVMKNMHDVQSLPDSPMIENSSSFGSSCSAPSMANLPPIRVRIEDNGTRLVQQDQKVTGIEEHFAQMTTNTAVKKEDEFVNGVIPQHIPSMATTNAIAPTTTVSSDNTNRVFSDDERSDQGAPVAFRKPPLPLQPVQPRVVGCFGLPSPDSVASDCSVTSANSYPKAIYYQDVASHKDYKSPASPNTKSEASDSSPQGGQVQQPQDPAYTLPPLMDQQQQQFVHASPHYIYHGSVAPVPMSHYYPVYAQPSQQQLHHPINQQYPVYVMPVEPRPTYNMALQSNMADTNAIAAASRAGIAESQTPAAVAASAPYKAGMPPMYPTRPATTTMPDMVQSVYKTAVASNASMSQSNQIQQQYMGYSQLHLPHQSIVGSSAKAHYGYEYVNPSPDQIYYNQHQAVSLPPQYQSISPAAAMALSEVAKQLPIENAPQQVRSSEIA